MLLTEDGHLDIERVKQLNEEELDAEMDSWEATQYCEWVGRNGTMTHEEVFGYISENKRTFWESLMTPRKTKKENQRISETIINGSRVFIEDGEVKVILSEEIERTGYMTVEEARDLPIAAIIKRNELKKMKETEDGKDQIS